MNLTDKVFEMAALMKCDKQSLVKSNDLENSLFEHFVTLVS